MSPAFPDFDFQLKRGQMRESILRDALMGEFEEVAIEAKSEVKSRTHVFIELKGYGKPSGLAISKAGWYAIEISEGVWILIETDLLWGLVDEALERFGMKHGGDQGASYGAIIPKDWFVKQR